MIEDKKPFKSITFSSNWDGEMWATIYEYYGRGPDNEVVKNKVREIEIDEDFREELLVAVEGMMRKPDDSMEEATIIMNLYKVLSPPIVPPPKPEGYYDE